VAVTESEGALPDFTENVFTEVMLDYLGERGTADGAAVCHYAPPKTPKGSIKINAWAVDEEEGIGTLCISLYHGLLSPIKLAKGDVDRALDQAARAFEIATDGWHEKMEPATEAYRMMRRFYEMRDEIITVDIILFTDALLPGEIKDRRIRKGPYAFRYDCWDLQRLYRLVASELPYESVVIDIQERFGLTIPCLPTECEREDNAVYLAVLPGRVLSELYDEYGAKLLDLNVRSFLQARGKVNKGIRDTLCREPFRFLAYNNGISATVESLEIVNDHMNRPAIRSVTGFQVVNGGQTMASIHRADKVDKAEVNDVFVQAKITVVPPDKIEALAPLISRYANSQNKINDADFSANDPIHVELQRLSEVIWTPGEQNRWFYERARGQYQVQKLREGSTAAKLKQFDSKCPTGQRFTKTDLAKYLNCWNRKPHTVSLGAQKNFVAFMEDLHESVEKDWRPDEKYFKEAVAKAIIFKAADKAARDEDVAYKANVVAYMVALLSEKSLGRTDLEIIWNTQAATEGIAETFSRWSKVVLDAIVSSAGDRNVTEWCKKEACWKMVSSADIQMPLSLRWELEKKQPMPTVGDVDQGEMSRDDHDNIARTMQVNAETWFKIADWGRKKKKLRDWRCCIAMTLAGYAQGSWTKVPSPKQANQAIRILRAAESEGLLE